jgi:hypothetical protein
MPTPTKSHDLRLPAWGPYTKRYAGISHIPDLRAGLRFDLSVIPGHYRRQLLIPNVKWESGYHAWESAPDLSYYAYRYELEWKDQVFCDVSFSALNEQARLVRCAFVNTTAHWQNLVLHLMASLNFPPVRPYSDDPIQMAKVVLPENGCWIDALDYEALQFAIPRPTDSLAPDGMLRAEIRDHGLVNGNGIGQGFGRDHSDMVLFRFQLAQPLRHAAITFRYRCVDAVATRVRVDGLAQAEVLLTSDPPQSTGFARLTLELGPLAAGEQLLQLVSLGPGAFDLDGFAVTEVDCADAVQFELHQWAAAPTIGAGPYPQSLTLTYADTDLTYGLAWSHADFRIRQILSDELDSFLRLTLPEHNADVLQGSGNGHFTNLFMRPITVPPQAMQQIYALICAGSPDDVDALLRAYAPHVSTGEAHYHATRMRSAVDLDCLPSGETYRFSQERMAATELLNVVYPVYTRRQFIRHYTPGKWWDCLYTWDSGFIGLALLELDPERAVDCLNAYVTDPGDSHAAFVHHGSPVPTQIYLLHELWNRTQDHALLTYFYPRLRQYYLFLTGAQGSSTTRALRSNLLRTWEYFFDSGGWDDYPAQLHTLNSGFAAQTTCVAITAHAIRSAKMLHSAATALGLADDQAHYEYDIALFSDALQRYAWDSEAGYFSYIMHDELGMPHSHLRHASGANFNMGLDGILPLLAGICTPEQEALMIQRLASPDHFWTRIGLSTIDQAAPYYRNDGYWNGAVWMPQQWFLWKTALDLGQGEFAYQIARTALELWKTEVETSYYCFEHFIIQSGRGAGWHQFGGLSSPVLAWFGAYHRPGRLTTGFDIWVEEQCFADDLRSFRGRLRQTGQPRQVTVLLTLQAGVTYIVRWNGQLIAYTERTQGTLEIDLPFVVQTGELEVGTRG